MTNEVFVHLIRFPTNKVHEAVTLNEDDTYSVFIDNRLSSVEAFEAYNHALKHINRNDFEKCDVSKIESSAHT